MLNPASVAGLFSAVVSLFALACVYPLGRVPDWEDLRPLTWVALTAAGVSASNLPASLELTPAVHIWTSRLEVTFVALHVLAWMVYLPGWANRPVRSLPPALWPLPALALSALVPGVVFGADAELTARPVAWLGVTYWDPGVRPMGYVIWAGIAAYAAWALVRVVRWGRTGAPYPRGHLACLGALFVMAVHDAAVMGGLLRLSTPYLLDFGFYLPVTFFGVMTLTRVSDHATDYHRLRAGLETAVADRSRMLEESRAALLQVERVALGRLSVGVAREVKAPATAAAASLELLSRDLAGVPDEVLRKLDEARAGVGHLLELARQLRLAGRMSGSGAPSLGPVRLASALEPALASARARAEHAQLRVSVPDDLWVRAHREALSEALAHLAVNAVLAIPVVRTGTVSVEAQRLGGCVRVVVEDDGVGMSEEELRHVFDPFQGAKPPGMGSGLGLAVARNLIESMQGTLRYESAVGRGSRAILELARPTSTTQGAAAVEASDPAAAARASLLVIDDDAQVLKSMARLLGRQHVVRTASSVPEGLAAVAEQTFDLILCDVMMPRGGGERFWAELLLNAPRLMDRVAFMTGGAPSHEARDFLRRTPRPVLVKPFDVMAVNELLDQHAGPRTTPQPEGYTSSGFFRLGRMGTK